MGMPALANCEGRGSGGGRQLSARQPACSTEGRAASCKGCSTANTALQHAAWLFSRTRPAFPWLLTCLGSRVRSQRDHSPTTLAPACRCARGWGQLAPCVMRLDRWGRAWPAHGRSINSSRQHSATLIQDGAAHTRQRSSGGSQVERTPALLAWQAALQGIQARAPRCTAPQSTRCPSG